MAFAAGVKSWSFSTSNLKPGVSVMVLVVISLPRIILGLKARSGIVDGATATLRCVSLTGPPASQPKGFPEASPTATRVWAGATGWGR
jgi:hypothetical protein